MSQARKSERPPGSPEADTSTDLADRSAAWLERIRAGDSSAWEELVREYSALVFAIARGMGHSEANCEEVFQKTWVSLYRQVHLIQEPRGLPAWIQVTARRHGWQLMRQDRSWRKRSEESQEGDEPLVGSPLSEVSDEELRHTVRLGLKALSPRCQGLLEALYLRAGDNSYDAVARDLELPRGTIGPTRIRCLAQLTRILERYGLREQDCRES